MPSIKLHTDHCISSGACVLEAPEAFALDDDGIVTQVDPDPPAEVWPKITKAAAVCPLAVIEIESP
jgi:ferredoxin